MGVEVPEEGAVWKGDVSLFLSGEPLLSDAREESEFEENRDERRFLDFELLESAKRQAESAAPEKETLTATSSSWASQTPRRGYH